ncbi:hypothetical protein KPATCC21470_7995 [Kitasatospora purpeofusca]
MGNRAVSEGEAGRRVRRSVAAALSCVLLAAWALCLAVLGTAPGAQSAPAAMPVPSLSPVTPVRSGPARPEVRGGPERSGSDAVVQRTTATEPAARPPVLLPAVLAPAPTVGPRALAGTYAAGPRQERAPPRDEYSPRHTRGPPSPRSS